MTSKAESWVGQKLLGDRRHDKETKRWQVLDDFVQLRVKARYVNVAEYHYVLDQFRGGHVEKLAAPDRLWRLFPEAKVNDSNDTVKELVAQLEHGWDDLAKRHANTPWATQAPREKTVQLGLTLRPAKT